MDHIGRILAYEQGELDDDEILDMFQAMIDDGSVWQLQGSYGRAAASLIAAAMCTPAEVE